MIGLRSCCLSKGLMEMGHALLFVRKRPSPPPPASLLSGSPELYTRAVPSYSLLNAEPVTRSRAAEFGSLFAFVSLHAFRSSLAARPASIAISSLARTTGRCFPPARDTPTRRACQARRRRQTSTLGRSTLRSCRPLEPSPGSRRTSSPSVHPFPPFLFPRTRLTFRRAWLI